MGFGSHGCRRASKVHTANNLLDLRYPLDNPGDQLNITINFISPIVR